MRVHEKALDVLPLLRRLPWLLPWVTNVVGEMCVGRRVGRLRGDPACGQHLRAVLHPLDILLTKSPFRVSDRLIPSYFTHAAVFLGDNVPAATDGPAWPSALGVGPTGALVVEAARSGVRIVGLDEFINVDTLAVLRDPCLPTALRQGIRQRALCELGKEYDFGFDGTDNDRHFCSKLVASLFAHLPFEERVGDRGIVLPDDIARLALATRPALSLELLFVDGTRVCPEQDEWRYASLLVR
jgi:hypothetical protein